MGKNEIKAIEYSLPIGWMKTLCSLEQKNQRYLQSSLSWFRSSPSLYRAILLAATKTSKIDLTKEFYKNHSTDKDLKNKVILDPFMRFGSILAEALRLNMEPIGIEINPVAWFFAKTLLEPVKKESLKAAQARLIRHKSIEGKFLEEALRSYYKTECPCCGSKAVKADIIRTFWIQTVVCTNAQCQKRIPLFDDFIIFQKIISIKYYPDYTCPTCTKNFDWDIESASLIAKEQWMINSPGDSAGVGRGNKRWAYGESQVVCPWCGESIEHEKTSNRTKQKKVLITVLLCPHCQVVWQYRGSLPNSVRCPDCGSSYYPRVGNIQRREWYTCPFCGTMDKISRPRLQPSDTQRLSILPYAIEGSCSHCQAQKSSKKISPESENLQGHRCLLRKSNGRFFKRISSNDLSHYLACYHTWNKHQSELPCPDSEIIENDRTHRFIENNYLYWIQLFNARQLLSLSSLLKAVDDEKDEKCRNQLLLAFLLTLETNNIFTTYDRKRTKVEGIFSKPELVFPYGYVENNVWGWEKEEGTFQYFFSKIIENNEFAKHAFDWQLEGDTFKKYFSGESMLSEIKPKIWCSNLSSLISQNFLKDVDLIVTEIPGEKDVRFTEWSDFYYHWLKLILQRHYSFFASEYSKRINDLNSPSRTRKQDQIYYREFKNILTKCGKLLKSNGLFISFFNYKIEKTWLDFLNSLFNAGYIIESILPVHLSSDAKKRMHKFDSLSLVHVCRMYSISSQKSNLSWQLIYQNIRAAILDEVERIHKKQYGKDELTSQEMQFILLGRGLKYLGKIYPQLTLEKKSIFMLERVLIKIRIFIDQALASNIQLPDELLDIEAESYIYLAYLSALYEIKASQFQTLTQNIIKAESLKKAGLIRMDTSRGERIYRVIHPLDRFDMLNQKLQSELDERPRQQALFKFVQPNGSGREPLFIDKIHFLMGLSLYDEDLSPWLARWQTDIDKIKAGCHYLEKQSEELAELTAKLLEKMH